MKMFINGKAADSSDGASIDVINPATGVVVDTVPAATAEDVASADRKSTRLNSSHDN